MSDIIEWKDLRIDHRVQKLDRPIAGITEEGDNRRVESNTWATSTNRPKTSSSSLFGSLSETKAKPTHDLERSSRETGIPIESPERRSDTSHITPAKTKSRQTVKETISPTGTQPDEPVTDVIRSAQESIPSPSVAYNSKDITHFVERSCAIERSLGIELHGIYAEISSEDQIVVNGELRSTQGNHLPQDLNLVITFHDCLDRIKHVEQVSFNSASLSGNQVFSVYWSAATGATTLAISKIRIQPGRNRRDASQPVKEGFIKKIVRWIKG